ncbi:Structural maintenance of chromosomes protein 6A, partial [Mucuna pruriens]
MRKPAPLRRYHGRNSRDIELRCYERSVARHCCSAAIAAAINHYERTKLPTLFSLLIELLMKIPNIMFLHSSLFILMSICSNAVIQVEIQNEGEDAFKPEIYGDVIIVERRISESTSSTTLRDHQGRKVVSRKADLLEIVEHFNIDVENPCVIMSQDKSREFLHSGNNKDKFKFFYKATLLQQVNDLLESISNEIIAAHGIVEELETAIRPIEKELNELQVKIRNMEHVEQISIQVQQLKKKLAWSWVYDVDKQLEEQSIKIEKLKNRIPTCQAKIDQQLHWVEKLKESCSKKKHEISSMLEKTSQVKQMKENLNQSVSMAKKEAFELERDCKCKTSNIQKLVRQLKMLEQQVQDTRQQHVKNTQAEESDMEEKLKGLKDEVHAAELELKRLKEEDALLMDSIRRQNDEIRKIADEIRDHEKNHRAITSRICDFQQHQSNMITVFGGPKVINLLRIIERNHQKFKMPPIGPIGAHLKLLHGKKWAVALEYAIGKLLNSFIVTDHADFRVLKQCAKEANYGYLQIIIYDFSTPRLTIPQHMLPHTEHPSILSVLQCENHTVVNVLVDLGNVERQVLVNDYEAGKVVAFERRIRNLKEVYTENGCRIFSRGSVQTVLPPNKRQRTGRLCGSFEDEIEKLHAEASDEQKAATDCKRVKREAEIKLEELDKNMNSIKRLRVNADKSFTSKKLALEEAMHLHTAENSATPLSSVDELIEEISEIQKKIDEEQVLLEGLQQKGREAAGKADDLKVKFDKLCGSANGEIAALEKAESELVEIEKEMVSAKKAKDHYEGVMNNKVVLDIKEAEEHFLELTKRRKESVEKASIICSQNELDSLGGCDGNTPEQVSAQLERLNQTLRRESQRHDIIILVHAVILLRLPESLRVTEEKVSEKCYLFEAPAFLEVQMPQDASNRAVRDTRGLSGMTMSNGPNEYLQKLPIKLVKEWVTDTVNSGRSGGNIQQLTHSSAVLNRSSAERARSRKSQLSW